MSIFNKPEADFDKIQQTYNDMIAEKTERFFDILYMNRYNDEDLKVYGRGIEPGNVVVYSDPRSMICKVGVVKEVFSYGKKYKIRVQCGPIRELGCKETILMNSALKITNSILDYWEMLGINIEEELK